MTAPRQPRRLADPDWLLAGAALLAAGLTSAFAARDPVHASATDSRPAIASVGHASGEVRRRPAGTLVWDHLAGGEPLRERDAVFVAPGASASLLLPDGTSFELEPSSLVVLEGPAHSEGARVALRKGTVLGRTRSRAVVVEGGGAQAELSASAEARVTVGQEGAVVDVFEGRAELRAGSSATALGPDQSVAVQGDGRLERRAAPPVRLEAPRRAERIWFTGAPPAVGLRWKGAGAPLRLQLAAGPAFSPPLLDAPVAGPEHAFTPPGAGSFWWRLVDAAGSPQSEIRRFVVVRDEPPVLRAPMRGEVVQVDEGGRLALSWSPVEGVERYRVELADSSTFAAPLVATEVEGTLLRLDAPVREGSYHWRVRALDPERGESPPSSSSFRLVVKPLLGAPELLETRIEVERGDAQP